MDTTIRSEKEVETTHWYYEAYDACYHLSAPVKEKGSRDYLRRTRYKSQAQSKELTKTIR